MDWKDQLSALRGNLDEPADEPAEVFGKLDSVKTNSEILRIVTDKKGRKGKIATIIEGFLQPNDKVEEIARQLKQKLGVGGSVRDGEILIQGDRKKEVIEFLCSLGFKTKLG